jgi:hypothetical protein
MTSGDGTVSISSSLFEPAFGGIRGEIPSEEFPLARRYHSGYYARIFFSGFVFGFCFGFFLALVCCAL